MFVNFTNFMDFHQKLLKQQEFSTQKRTKNQLLPQKMFELSPALTKAQLQTMNTRNRQVSRFTRAATPQNVELTENIQFYGSIALFG